MERRHDVLVSDLCEENDVLRYELEQARIEANNWREKYFRQLNASEDHHKKLMKAVFDNLIEVP